MKTISIETKPAVNALSFKSVFALFGQWFGAFVAFMLSLIVANVISPIPDLAEKVENIWEKLMEEMITFSKDPEKLSAPNSGHYMHLTDQKIVLDAIRKNLLSIAST